MSEIMLIPTAAEKRAAGEKIEVLFWVGCAGSFDDRYKRVTEAVVRILHHCQIDFNRYAGYVLIDPIALQSAAFGVYGINLDRVAQVDLVVDNIGRMTVIGQ